MLRRWCRQQLPQLGEGRNLRRDAMQHCEPIDRHDPTSCVAAPARPRSAINGNGDSLTAFDPRVLTHGVAQLPNGYRTSHD